MSDLPVRGAGLVFPPSHCRHIDHIIIKCLDAADLSNLSNNVQAVVQRRQMEFVVNH